MLLIDTVILEDIKDIIDPCNPENHNCEEVCISITSTEHVCTGRCLPWEVLCHSKLVNTNHNR